MIQKVTKAQSNTLTSPNPHAPFSNERLVALYMLDLAAQDGNRALTPLQINKLIYISHGWVLGAFGRPLIDNSVSQIQAWKYGPVVVGIYHMLKSFENRPISIFDFYAKVARRDGFYDVNLLPEPEAKPLILSEFKEAYPEVTKGLDWVYSNYIRYTGGQLITLTRQEGTPWHQCYHPGILEQWGLISRDIHIPDPLIKAYYEKRIKRSYAP